VSALPDATKPCEVALKVEMSQHKPMKKYEEENEPMCEDQLDNLHIED
jgi:hypothetical protein